MEEDERLQLDQRTAARNLKVATKEIQKATGVIASLEGPATGGKDFSSVIGRVHDLIDDANVHILRYPDAGGETNSSTWNVSLYDTPNTTTSTATGAAFLEEDEQEVSAGNDAPSGVQDLFQAAVAHSYDAMHDDQKILQVSRSFR